MRKILAFYKQPVLLSGWLFFVIPLLATVIIAIYWYHYGSPFNDGRESLGQFGDYFGGLFNPIIGLIGLLALFKTIHLQSTEIRLSTEELRRSAAALDLQSKVMQRQAFESTFFQMLKLYTETFENMTVRLSSREARNLIGEPAIRHLNEELKYFIIFAWQKSRHGDSAGQPHLQRRDVNAEEELQWHASLYAGEDVTTAYAQLSEAYRAFYETYGYIFSSYCRIIYLLLEMVDRSFVDNDEKAFYVKVIRAQLLKEEMVLLFYYCLSGYGGKLLPLIKRYDLLKPLNSQSLFDPSHHALFEMHSEKA